MIKAGKTRLRFEAITKMDIFKCLLPAFHVYQDDEYLGMIYTLNKKVQSTLYVDGKPFYISEEIMARYRLEIIKSI